MNPSRTRCRNARHQLVFLIYLAAGFLLWQLRIWREERVFALPPSMAILTERSNLWNLQLSSPLETNEDLDSGEDLEGEFMSLNSSGPSEEEDYSFPLLHSLTDDQLFGRAVCLAQADKKKGRLAQGPINIGRYTPQVIEPALGRRRGKSGFQGQKASKPFVEKGKIAFCFLTTGPLPLIPLWNEFLKGHEDLFSIYVHMYPLSIIKFNGAWGPFQGRLITSDVALRGTPSLISAARRLMANAIIDDPQNEWFAILSETCIPLRSFSYLYNVLSSTEKSFIEVLDQSPLMRRRYTVLTGLTNGTAGIHFGQFRIGSQFFVLRKRHAVMFLNDTKYWSIFNHPCAPDRSCFHEESYFSTVMDILDRKGSTRYASHYVNWNVSHASAGHPKLFSEGAVSRQFIVHLRNANAEKFLFARKFHESALHELLSFSDILFSDRHPANNTSTHV